jgi:ribonuclease Z
MPMVQDRLLDRALARAMNRAIPEPPAGGLRVTLCGTSSPVPHPTRAQACVAIQVDHRLFLVDAGAGSANVAALAGLPLERLEAIFLTHFHSDHIAAIADFALLSWVAGRPVPLALVGPSGVTQVAKGLNRLYALDGGYRVRHHGPDLLPPDLHDLVPRTISPGVVYDEGGLVVQAFTVDHHPVAPAVGYRFDYGGRSVVVTGDTVVNDALREAVTGADLVLADALSPTLVDALVRATRAAGRDRQAAVFEDIRDYHASTADLATLARDADIGLLALYHLVPAPRNALMARIFARGLPDEVILTEDGTAFLLPPDSERIEHLP